MLMIINYLETFPDSHCDFNSQKQVTFHWSSWKQVSCEKGFRPPDDVSNEEWKLL